MRLRSRKRERPLSSKRTSKVTKLKNIQIQTIKPLSKPDAWKPLLKREKNNGVVDTPFCITRSQKLKTRPVRTKLSMEKPLDTSHKKSKHKDESRTKKPIFQTVVRSTTKDTVSSSTAVKKPQNEKISTTSKTKEVRTTKSVQLRHSSLNRELRKTEAISSAMSSPRKTRRMDKTDKSASLNSSPIRKVRQMSIVTPKITKSSVSSTNESPKKRTKKAPIVPETNCYTEDTDVTMYEAHTTTLLDFTTQKSEESDSDGQVESSELCLPNDCLNDFMAIAECAQLINEEMPATDEDINFLADKAARVMTTEKSDDKKSRNNSVDKRLTKRRKSSNDLEMYQPSSTTDDLDHCADFLTNGEKYVQVCIFSGIKVLPC